MAHVVGGFGAAKAADADVNAVFSNAGVRAKIAEHTGAIESFSVDSYKTQVVAGTNFLARVHVNGKVYTVKVFRPLPHTGAAPEVSSVTEGDHL